MGRPKLNIDLDDVRELAAEGNTQEDIADLLGFSRSTFRTRKDVKDAYNDGMADLRSSLRHWQVLAAKNGDTKMLIWLGKNLLKQKDVVPDEPVAEKESLYEDELSKSLRELAEGLKSDDK